VLWHDDQPGDLHVGLQGARLAASVELVAERLLLHDAHCPQTRVRRVLGQPTGRVADPGVSAKRHEYGCLLLRTGGGVLVPSRCDIVWHNVHGCGDTGRQRERVHVLVGDVVRQQLLQHEHAAGHRELQLCSGPDAVRVDMQHVDDVDDAGHAALCVSLGVHAQRVIVHGARNRDHGSDGELHLCQRDGVGRHVRRCCQADEVRAVRGHGGG
jgi:ABC-type transporter Mla MlaB component